MKYKVTVVATRLIDQAVVIVDAANKEEAGELALRKVNEDGVEWEEIDDTGDPGTVIECEPAVG
jgi:hypothetical protein